MGLALFAVELLQNEIADGIDVGADAFRVANAVLGSQCAEYADKGFLLNIVDNVGGEIARAQLDTQKLAEIADKVAFRLGMAIAETLNIVGIE